MAKKVIESMYVGLGTIVEPGTNKVLKEFNLSLTKTEKIATKTTEKIADMQKGIRGISAKDISALSDKVQSVRSDFADFGRELAAIAGWVAKAAAGFAGLTAALAANTISIARDSQQIQRQADLLGLTTDAYQELRGVFEGYGVDQRDITDIFAQIAQYTKMAEEGGKGAVQTFKELGIGVEQLKGKSVEEVFNMIAQGAATAKDPLATLGKLLGEEALKQAGPLLIQGADAIGKLRDEYSALGGVIQEEQLNRYKQLARVMSRFQIQMRAIRIQIATAFLPAVEHVSDALQEWITTNREAISTRLQEYVTKIGDAFTWVADRAKELDAFVQEKFGGWKPVLTGIAIVLTAIVTTLGAFALSSAALAGIAAIAGLGAAIGVGFGAAAGIVAALAAGIVVLVAEFTALVLILQDLYYFLSGEGQSFIGDFVNQFKESNSVLGAFARYFEALKAQIEAGIPVVKTIGSILYDVFVIGLTLAGQMIDEVMNSPFGRLLSWAANLLSYLNPIRIALEGITAAMKGMTAIAGPVGNLLKSFEGGISDFAVGMGAKAPEFTGPMLSSANAAPLVASGASGGNTTINRAGDAVNINMVSPDPALAGRNVERVLAERNRSDMKKASGGVR